MKKTVIAILLLLGVHNCLKAQVDPHFSQYYANPLWLNPALAGVFDGDARININAKDQWQNISNGYKTEALSVDFHATDKVALGFNLVNQAAGTSGYNYFAAYGTFGYWIAVSADGNKKLHFGVQAGLINRSFNPNDLQLDDQYSPGNGFDPGLPGFETFSTTSATVFDASAGIFYYDADATHTANIFGGISAAHINGPQDPFAITGLKSTLPIRLTIHGGVKIKASDFFDITPHIIYIKQQENQLKAIGVYSELKFQENSGLIIGGMYRINDAAVADVGYHIKNLVMGFSYDFNTSALNKATNSQGGPELSLSYIFGGGPKNPSNICPKF